MSAQGTIRRQVFFSGTVQGVNFRYHTVALSRRFQVTGFVRNLPDGRVQLVAEGQPEVLQAFVRAVSDEMGRFISRADSSDSGATGEFHGFQIAY